MPERTAVGVEIQESAIYLAELALDADRPVILRLKTITIPPKVITGGEITDLDSISSLIDRALKEDGFDSRQLYVSLLDRRFVKRTKRVQVMKSADLMSDIEDSLSSIYPFTRQEFQVGYQIGKRDALDKEVPIFWEVLYAGIAQSKVDSLLELAEHMDLHFSSIDLSCLSALRVMTWLEDSEQTVLCVFADQDYIDLNIVSNRCNVSTFTIRLKRKEDLSIETLKEQVLTKINLILFVYNSKYTDFPVPTRGLFLSRNAFLDPLFPYLQEALPDISFDIVSPQSVCQFSDTISFSDQSDHNIANYVVSIGLALKQFESFGQTLSFIKQKKQIGPIFNMQELKISVLVFVSLFTLLFGLDYYINLADSRIESDVADVKRQIVSLQSGEYIKRQKQLRKYQDLITRYDKIRSHNRSKTEFLQLLVRDLPEDLSLLDIDFNKKNQVRLSGKALYQDSIYAFYNHLKAHFDDVKIASIVTKYSGDVPENKFAIEFIWM